MHNVKFVFHDILVLGTADRSMLIINEAKLFKISCDKLLIVCAIFKI